MDGDLVFDTLGDVVCTHSFEIRQGARGQLAVADGALVFFADAGYRWKRSGCIYAWIWGLGLLRAKGLEEGAIVRLQVACGA